MSREKIYQSDIADFHNQKDPNFDPDSGVIIAGGPEYEKYARYIDEINKKEVSVEKGKAEQQIEKLIGLLDSLELEEKYRADKNEQDLLTVKKDQAKSLIAQTLKRAGNYVAVREKTNWLMSHGQKEDIRSYQSAMEDSDYAQRLAHNALIDSINIVNRFISLNFSKTDKAIITEWQKKETHSGRALAHIERVTFPKNIICLDKTNLKDRDSIAQWAQELYKDLAINKKWSD